MNIEVLYEDNHLIAVNKPAGLVVQDNEHGLPSLEEHVKEYIRIKYDKPGAVFLGCIHRLDTNVTGIVLFARTSKALVRMNEQFKERIEKNERDAKWAKEERFKRYLKLKEEFGDNVEKV